MMRTKHPDTHRHTHTHNHHGQYSYWNDLLLLLPFAIVSLLFLIFVFVFDFSSSCCCVSLLLLLLFVVICVCACFNTIKAKRFKSSFSIIRAIHRCSAVSVLNVLSTRERERRSNTHIHMKRENRENNGATN